MELVRLYKWFGYCNGADESDDSNFVEFQNRLFAIQNA